MAILELFGPLFMTDFYEKVYAVVRKIPRGRVCTYGDIAEFLGSKSSSRVVGYAMNAAHRVHPFVPAHRVVNRLGILSGKHHFETPTLMQDLLESEGIVIKNDQIQHFERVRWYPAQKRSS